MTTGPDQTLTDDELRVLETLLARLSGPGADLPWPLFRFVTEVMATSNVDLLVQDDAARVLLAWRDDPFGTGWHVPGSIIRHREEIAHRIAACAADELGCAVDADDRPIALIQIFDERSHSISLVFRVALRGMPGRRVVDAVAIPEAGDLCWFASLPDRIYPSHLVYRDVIDAVRGDRLGDGMRVFTQHVGARDAAQASPDGEISAETSLTAT